MEVRGEEVEPTVRPEENEVSAQHALRPCFKILGSAFGQT